MLKVELLLLQVCIFLIQINQQIIYIYIYIYVQLVSKCSVLENVESTFQRCTGLNGELSSNIFTKKNNPRITNFKYTFNGCSNLEGYTPPLWTQYPGIDGEGCFAGCNKLGNIADVPTQWK